VSVTTILAATPSLLCVPGFDTVERLFIGLRGSRDDIAAIDSSLGLAPSARELIRLGLSGKSGGCAVEPHPVRFGVAASALDSRWGNRAGRFQQPARDEPHHPFQRRGLDLS
jgi:hypothetical protein